MSFEVGSNSRQFDDVFMIKLINKFLKLTFLDDLSFW